MTKIKSLANLVESCKKLGEKPALSRSEITTLLGEKMYRIETIYLEEKSLNREKVELMKEITALKDQIRL